MRDRVKDVPVAFRPPIALRQAMEAEANRHHLSIGQWVESVCTREVYYAAAVQGETHASHGAPAD